MACTVGEVSEIAELELNESYLRNSVKQTEIGVGVGPEGADKIEERAEHRRLRGGTARSWWTRLPPQGPSF